MSSLDVVCCSLESWDQVWRRNQFFAREMLRLDPRLRLLFVEPPLDVTWTLLKREWPRRGGIRPIGDTGRLWAMPTRKWLPRKVLPQTDQHLGAQVRRAARRLGMNAPVLWINDSTYADLVRRSGWPTVYDITDDWLLATHHSERELTRQRRNDEALIDAAAEVIVCSPALEASRGGSRDVRLIPNGVDIEHVRTPQGRPADLPDGPTVTYVGTLASDRLDIDLCRDLTVSLRGRASVVFVGPNSLTAEDDRTLRAAGAVLLGARRYGDIPGYLQHADVLVVPHAVNPFTESLDPIKAREFLAVGRPVVTTPVAGFRDLASPVVVASPADFVSAVQEALTTRLPAGPGPLRGPIGSWTERARNFHQALERANAAAKVVTSRS